MPTLDLTQFSKKKTILTDGAWGTQLQARGLPIGDAPDFWNVTHADKVESVARAYVDAGSDVILTNTFGANRVTLGRQGHGDRAAELIERGVAISRKAVTGTKTLVFASLGPSGALLAMGDVTEEELTQAYTEAALSAQRGGADALLLETFEDIEEARLAIQACKASTPLPVVLSMTFSSGSDKTRTMMGVAPADLANLGRETKADVIGANCGVGPEHYIKITEMLRQAWAGPIWIKANAGLPELTPEGKTIYRMTPQAFAQAAPKLITAGANFLGGCCGTTPDHIRALRAVI